MSARDWRSFSTACPRSLSSSHIQSPGVLWVGAPAPSRNHTSKQKRENATDNLEDDLMITMIVDNPSLRQRDSDEKRMKRECDCLSSLAMSNRVSSSEIEKPHSSDTVMEIEYLNAERDKN
uniref:Uncharacterized protein n=1 Tax=Pristionchus pacificus TaxID=54126 RepID=A0A2A6BLW5_PRIPA|eukprot:PDM66889.1 hypothetical protein PRIPAC_48306 [Pristionchus pacificus]